MNNEESSKELKAVLWSGADILRSKMDANEYKDYLLSFIFYKFLSDKFLAKAYNIINDEEPDTITEAQEVYEEFYNSEDRDDLLEDLKDSCSYIIEPELTFSNLAKNARNNEFKRGGLTKGIQ